MQEEDEILEESLESSPDHNDSSFLRTDESPESKQRLKSLSEQFDRIEEESKGLSLKPRPHEPVRKLSDQIY